MRNKDSYGLTRHQIYRYAQEIELGFGKVKHPIIRHAEAEALVCKIATEAVKAAEERAGLRNYWRDGYTDEPRNFTQSLDVCFKMDELKNEIGVAIVKHMMRKGVMIGIPVDLVNELWNLVSRYYTSLRVKAAEEKERERIKGMTYAADGK